MLTVTVLTLHKGSSNGAQKSLRSLVIVTYEHNLSKSEARNDIPSVYLQ